jgi:hypothetical protein
MHKMVIDTFTVLYTGYAAQNSGKMAEAITYYEKIAKLKIGGQDFLDMYRYMLDYYSKTKKEAEFNQTLALSRQLFPNEQDIWSQTEAQGKTAMVGLNELAKKYQEADAAGNMTSAQYRIYADELTAATLPDQINIKLLSADAYEKAFGKEANGVYAYNAGVMHFTVFNYLYDKFYNLNESGSDNKPLLKDAMLQADKSVEWFEKSNQVLKTKAGRNEMEDTCFTRSIKNLLSLYEWERGMAGGTDTDAYKKWDTKFKQLQGEQRNDQ